MARTPNSPSHAHASPGVTLIECCTVLAIIAACAALAAPGFKKTLIDNQARTASHLLAANLASARATAITRRNPVSLCPSLDGHSCTNQTEWGHGWLMYLDPTRQSQPTRVDHILRAEIRGESPIRILSSTGRTTIRFQPNGKSSGSNVTFEICHRNDLRSSVVINNVGRVRTQRPSRSSSCD